MPADLLIYVFIAAGLVFWLRSILGTKHGDERTRENPFLPNAENTSAEKDAHTPEPAAGLSISLFDDTPRLELPRNVSLADQAKTGLDDIAKADKSFNLQHFLSGAEGAFIMIVEAFAKGERETLQGLLSDSVFKVFDGAIKGREENGETVDTEIHSVRQMDILDARMIGRDAVVTVQFTADETCVIKDKEGVILSGDPERITEMKDIWVFARDVKSKGPSWKLIETRDGEEEDHKTPVPDSHPDSE